jgi:hypothetical protein
MMSHSDMGKSAPQNSRLLAQTVLGLSIVIAAAITGAAFIKVKSFDQTVEVKGLAERVVKANEASLIIEFQAQDESITQLNEKVTVSRTAIEEFIKDQGFEPTTIQRQPIAISQDSDYGKSDKKRAYRATGSVQFSSPDVDKLTKSSEATNVLLAKGVIVTRTSVNYYFTSLNDIKPEMLKEAAEKAREAADRFAASSGVKVGGIKRADQGPFSITAPYSEWGNETSSMMKRVRVVTNVSFFIER